jgi:hypothetical protein
MHPFETEIALLDLMFFGRKVLAVCNSKERYRIGEGTRKIPSDILQITVLDGDVKE